MRKLSVILIVLLIFLTSCGIPSIRDFSSAISFTASTTDSAFTLRFNSTAVNASYFTNGMINDASPSIVLLYTVTNEPDDRVAASFKTTFNREVRGGNTYINGIPLTIMQNDGILDTTYGSNTYKLYPLVPGGRTVSPPQYTLCNGVDYVFSSLTASSVKFSFECKKVADTDEDYYVELKKDGEPYLSLYRYSGDAFRTSRLNEYRDVSDTGESYYIHIFAAVNVTKGRSSDFSNDYWTELKTIASIKIGE